MAEKEGETDAPETGKHLHVTVLLVASRRALDMALNELGFLEDDDRIIEHDGRLAFLTCSHDPDSACLPAAGAPTRFNIRVACTGSVPVVSIMVTVRFLPSPDTVSVSSSITLPAFL